MMKLLAVKPVAAQQKNLCSAGFTGSYIKYNPFDQTNI
jgi:hypothetical protein